MKQIIDGHIKELFNRDKPLYEQRMEICRECKLMTKDKIFGNICDRNKWLNLDTNELSNTKKDGFYNGCGCRLNAKARLAEASCPNNK